ncbi:peroxisomal membrane protein 11C [Anastrepha obliqua]|uniref:peroxisomal membrane protein 11C n=1 Tax=Anastrepha ludens TaxID=28586 RepID=UPI0023B18575|nr:peroxisomal membrane protein 11C [Anastrepha ludens]XP_053946334.1 peroxisomal membrane protein 11C [Anastrepha ludens]XP_053946335.1 peroxisomal membrane protein 11C [Anastrepha ludens]XP_054726654.1 peroxisomal membrane protein 11C [Anastrepha obliqua]XP_054726655.1 peroxisomal membrane protein 11C [Anastrepha obliqua]
MSTTKLVNEFCEIIDTYGGRDKVMKALCYSAKLIAGYHSSRNPELAKRYAITSSRISGARATLRLIDDIPMIQYALEYGLGTAEPDRLMAVLGVSANIVDLLFYPVEKICWLSEHNIIDVKNADAWDVLNSSFWVLSVYLNLMRTLRSYSLNQQKFNEVNVANSHVDEKVLKKHRLELLSVLRLSLDFAHAVSTLPKGYLWGGKLSTFQVGAIGTLSAGIGIYQLFAKRRLNK